jgi:hypothetical protein
MGWFFDPGFIQNVQRVAADVEDPSMESIDSVLFALREMGYIRVNDTCENGFTTDECVTGMCELQAENAALRARLAEVEAQSRCLLELEAQVEKQGEMLNELKKAMAAKDKELVAYRNALTPSSETKAAYIGEIEWTREVFDENGMAEIEILQIPWTSMKEFMAMIRGYAKSTMNR